MADSARVGIMTAYEERINALFNATDGTEAQIYRKSRRGPLRRVRTRPAFTVVDGGARLSARYGTDDGEVRTLALRIALHICDTWEKEETIDEWSNHVALLIEKLHGRPPGYGVLAVRYVSDDPVDVVFLSGSSQGDWVLDWEVDFVAGVDEYDDWA